MRKLTPILLTFCSLASSIAVLAGSTDLDPAGHCSPGTGGPSPLSQGSEIAALKERVIVENHDQPFLSVTLRSAAFRGATPAETRARVEAFLKTNGFRMDSFVDYDLTLFVGFEEKIRAGFNPVGAIKRGFELDGKLSKLRALSYVREAQIVEHKRLGSDGRMESHGRSISVSFEKGREPYEAQVAELKYIMGPDYEAKPVSNKEKAGTLWASASGSELQRQMSEAEMSQAVARLKAVGGEHIVSAEMHFKLMVANR